MPRISDERKEERREQVLEAARACLLEYGLEAVSMEMIITRSGLSTGAIYGYFKGKEQIINAVVTEGTAQLGRELLPLLTNPEPLPPAEFMEQILETIVKFSVQGRETNRLLVSIHGWSHSQSTPELRTAARTAYRQLRNGYVRVAKRWRASGLLDSAADPAGVAELLMSITLGFVAQRTLAGSADVSAHVAALGVLSAQKGRGRVLSTPRA